MAFKIDYGHGAANKPYRTISGAKLAARAWMKNSGQPWVYIIEVDGNGVVAKDIYRRST